jgi:hypothetical protein
VAGRFVPLRSLPKRNVAAKTRQAALADDYAVLNCDDRQEAFDE